MENTRRSNSFFLSCVFMSLLVISSTATMEEEEKECADQLANLAACIPFVSGSAKKPTPECCQNAKKVKENKPKCLCVLIRESSDPSMGLPVNTTLALQMPSACHIDAKVSDCPSILKIPLNSPEAKIFKEGNDDITASSGSSSSTSSVSGSKSDSNVKANNTAKLHAFSSMNLLLVIVALMASIFV